jgi:cellulose synthase/poly-beta-1,6-N-acetylglucosamine synthase-like glycosyltransferase
MPSTHNHTLPDIDCVVIGVNTEATLARCLTSIKQSHYPIDRLHIIYVDGGSLDGSIQIAEEIEGVRVVSLNDPHPTPGRGRNAGWRSGDSHLVQFLDSDTVIEPDWLEKAVAAMADSRVGAVQGYRKEMYPERSVYNWLTSLEWNGPPGVADSFGGDVLIRREILEQTNGYDEIMVGGEDPELSQRVQALGWKIIQLDTVMTHHDIAMTRPGQYWKRAFRSGYGFAAVIDRAVGRENRFWFTEFRRILVRGGGFVVLSGAALLCLLAGILVDPLFLAAAALLLAAGLFLLLFPRLFRVDAFMKNLGLNRQEARIYAWHCSLVVIPDIFGVVRYYYGKISNRPLRNTPHRLKTQKTDT